MGLEKRAFGQTGLEVFPLGFGAGHIGREDQSEKEVERLLHELLDLGINLIDTARGYGASEERIGKFLSDRRQEFILSTKVGYDVPGYQDWTGEIILAGIDRALKTMQTDYLDIVHLHSCDLAILQEGEVIEALLAAKKAGKIRLAAYSGENEALSYAVDCGAFDSIECSINLLEQKALEDQVTRAHQKGMGVIAKRPIANAPWRYDQRPVGEYVLPYWDRLQVMPLPTEAFTLQELALRFVGFDARVPNIIIGSSKMEHIKENLAILEKGPLPEDILAEIKEAFHRHGKDWYGQI